MKKRSLKKYLPGGLTNLQQNVKGVNPNAEVLGETAGSAIGTGAGMALNAVVPGLGFIAAPILGKLGGMAGKAIGDKFDTSDDKAEEERKRLETSYSQFNDVNNTYSLQSNTGRGLAFANGGVTLNQDDPNATEELELNEQFQTPDGQVGEVDGPSHEMGGIQTNLPEGTRVFSDRLKHNGRTFAKIVKPINTQIAKVESNPHTSKTIKENTLMLLNKQLDQYFNIQETNKQNSEMKRSLKMAKGGIVKNYKWGGPLEKEEFITGSDPNYGKTQLTYPSNTPLESGWNFSNTNPQPTSQDVMNADNNPVSLIPRMPVTTTEIQTNQPVLRELNVPTLKPVDINSFVKPQTPNSETSKVGSFLGNNAGQLGQITTAGITTALQARNLNKLARPKTLAKIKLADKIANPNLVNYSGQREDIDRTALSQMDVATRSLSNSATAQAFRNQANINRLRGTGKSWQDESNTNTQIKNQFLGQRNQAQMQEEMANNEIDKYNLENSYNYDAFKTGQKGQIIGTLGETAGQVFGNQSKYQNQLDQAKILSHSYDPTVYKDADGNVIKKNSWKRNGGVVGRSFAAGGVSGGPQQNKPKPKPVQTNYGFEQYYNHPELFEQDSINFTNLDPMKQWLLSKDRPVLPEAKQYSDSTDWYENEVKKAIKANPNAFRDPNLGPILTNYENRAYQNTMKSNAIRDPYDAAFDKLPLGARYRMNMGKPMPIIPQHKNGGTTKRTLKSKK